MLKSKTEKSWKSPERRGVGAYVVLFNSENGIKEELDNLETAYFSFVGKYPLKDIRKVWRKKLLGNELNIKISSNISAVPGKNGFFIPVSCGGEILVLFPFPGLSDEKEVMIYLKKETFDLEKLKKLISELEKAMPIELAIFLSRQCQERQHSDSQKDG